MNGWLRLVGTRFRCTPMYALSEDLDPLAQLFMKVLKNGDQELRNLVGAFGLTARVVEDVLGDLLRRNRATLIIKNGRQAIQLLDDSIPNVALEAGDPLEVWQDHATGLVLPAHLIDRFKREGDRVFILKKDENRRLIGPFVDAPDGQLIEMLVSADQELREREESLGTLDRLADRFQLRPQLVWLPVVEANLDSFTVPQIHADGIPGWVVRIWSVALRNQELQKTDGATDERALYSLANLEVQAIVDGWRASARLDEWYSAVRRFLAIRPAPTSGYELRAVRDRHAALSDYFMSVGQVTVRTDIPHGDLAWILDVMEAAREWLVIVLSRPGDVDALIELLRGREERNEHIPGAVLVIVPEPHYAPDLGQKLRKVLNVTRTGDVVCRRQQLNGADIALCEAGLARAQHAASSPPLDFFGDKIAGEFLNMLQSLPLPENAPRASEHNVSLRTLRMRRSATSVVEDDDIRLGEAENAPSIGVAMAAVRDFSGELLNAVVDPDGVHRRDAGLDAEGAADGWTFDSTDSLEDQLPVLAERLEALTASLSVAPRAPWVHWRRLTSYDLLPVVVAALSYPRVQSVAGEIDFLFSGIGQYAMPDAIVGLLKEASTTHGWRIRIGFPPGSARDEKRRAQLKALRVQIPDARLEFYAVRSPAPASAILLGDVVFLGNSEWLELTPDVRLAAEKFAFSIEGQGLAENLRNHFDEAECIRLE